MSKDGVENRKKYKGSTLSNFIGSAIGGTLEQLSLHWIDTFAKNGAAGKKKSDLLWSELKNATTYHDKVKRLYKGLSTAIVKKVPMRAYKYAMEKRISEFLETHYSKEFDRFGNKKKLLMKTLSAIGTAWGEPILFHWLDTVQVRSQILKHSFWETMRTMSIRELYNGAGATALFRNTPGCIALFTGSEACNELLGNEDKKNNWLNLFSKYMGSLGSLLFSQVGDVIKTRMQVEQIPITKVLKNVSFYELATDGLQYRLLTSVKVALGFFVIEKLMLQTDELLGIRIEVNEKGEDIEVDQITERLHHLHFTPHYNSINHTPADTDKSVSMEIENKNSPVIKPGSNHRSTE